MATAAFENLKDKRALVTGGAMGIGLATARRLLKEGCHIAVWDINEAALGEAKSGLEEEGGRLFTCLCDVSDREVAEEAARKTTAELGGVDILINNAGIVRAGMFTDIPVEQHEIMTAVNLTSIYYTLHAFLPGMLERNSGHVVNISSAGGMSGVPLCAVYSATKWAVWGLTESLRMEAEIQGKDGLCFTSVHPHVISTGLFEGSRLNNWMARLIMPGIETHDEVAGAIVEKALKKGHQQILLPRTLWLIMAARSFLPSGAFASFMNYMGLDRAMEALTEHKPE